MDNPRVTQKFYDGSDQLIYKCCNLKSGAADGDTDWEVTKYTWTGSVCTKRQVLTGSVTGRASLVW
jgi:hypothetical protein